MRDNIITSTIEVILSLLASLSIGGQFGANIWLFTRFAELTRTPTVFECMVIALLAVSTFIIMVALVMMPVITTGKIIKLHALRMEYKEERDKCDM